MLKRRKWKKKFFAFLDFSDQFEAKMDIKIYANVAKIKTDISQSLARFLIFFRLLTEFPENKYLTEPGLNQISEKKFQIMIPIDFKNEKTTIF